MKRWVCSSCSSGVNAPERPRRDDVRRYCLDCSKESGRLVERTCPSLDRRRAISGEQAAAKRATDRQRARDEQIAKRTIGDVDLLVEAKRLWRLPVMREQTRWHPQLPRIYWRRSSTKSYTSGRSFGGSIVLTIGSESAAARETLLHELIHEVLPRGVHHGDPFYRVLVRAAREAWPLVEFPPMPPLRRAWERDQWVRRIVADAEASHVDDDKAREGVMT